MEMKLISNTENKIKRNNNYEDKQSVLQNQMTPNGLGHNIVSIMYICRK